MTMHKIIALLLVVSLTACNDKPNEVTTTKSQTPEIEIVDNYLDGWLQQKYTNESEKANEFFARVFKDTLSRNPEMQTYLGIKDDYSKWNDISDEKSQAFYITFGRVF